MNFNDSSSNASDSEDDCDYVPPGDNQAEVLSNEDSNSEIDSGDEEKPKKTRLKKTRDKFEDDEKPPLTEEEEKKKANDLWNDFKKSMETNKKPSSNVIKSEPSNLLGQNSKDSPNVPVLPEQPKTEPKKVTVAEIFDFAGENVTVTKEMIIDSNQTSVVSKPKSEVTTATASVPAPKRRAGGLAALVDNFTNKKPKMNTLQKSLYDWKTFKQSEGIEEDLEHHNKGKDGYLEKQRFLQRSDIRQYEIERDLRLSRRSRI